VVDQKAHDPNDHQQNRQPQERSGSHKHLHAI